MKQHAENLNTKPAKVRKVVDRTIRDTCDRYWSIKEKTYAVTDIYGGLPEALVVGIIWLIAFLLIFSIIRRYAWNHGRLALIHRMANRHKADARPAYDIWTSLFVGAVNPEKAKAAQRESVDTRVFTADKGLFSWIPAFLRITDEEMHTKCGQDAVQFLIFERYVLVYSVIVAAVCILIVFPLNLTQGNTEGSRQHFGTSTINNLDSESLIIWIHCLIALTFLFLGIIFMHHFVTSVRYNSDEMASKTLMISKIPVDKCFKHLILQHFEEAYPESDIDDVQFAYDVTRLNKLTRQRDIAEAGLKFSQTQAAETGVRPKIMPYRFSICCCKCCASLCVKEVDAIDYYTEHFELYDEFCEAEKVTAFNSTLGFAFVTFDEEVMAYRIARDLRWRCGRRRVRPSTVSAYMEVHNWTVQIAPAPDDIYWHNLSIKPSVWWIKTVIGSIILLAFVVFLTTPTVVFNQMIKLRAYDPKHKHDEENWFQKFLHKSFPSLLLMIASSFLPLIVKYIDKYFIGYYTKTSLNRSIMIKLYLFLLIMILIMPALGFSSIGTLVHSLARKPNSSFQWNCVFGTKTFEFYATYMANYATFGIGFGLLRTLSLLKYFIKMLWAKSEVERKIIEQNQAADFDYGLTYAKVLCMFTVMMVYSIPSPMITFPGVLFLSLRYLSDRYDLFYTSRPSKIDDSIHENAGFFVVVSIALLSVHLLFYLIYYSELPAIRMFLGIALAVIFIGFVISMIVRRQDVPKPRGHESVVDVHAPEDIPPLEVYVPDLLQEDEPSTAAAEGRKSREFGSVERGKAEPGFLD